MDKCQKCIEYEKLIRDYQQLIGDMKRLHVAKLEILAKFVQLIETWSEIEDILKICEQMRSQIEIMQSKEL